MVKPKTQKFVQPSLIDHLKKLNGVTIVARNTLLVPNPTKLNAAILVVTTEIAVKLMIVGTKSSPVGEVRRNLNVLAKHVSIEVAEILLL